MFNDKLILYLAVIFPTVFSFACNVRSVKNKAMIVKDYVVDNDIDIMALAETWL